MDAEEFEFAVLSRLVIGTKRHGYAIVSSINERYGTTFPANKTYPILDRLEKQGDAIKRYNPEALAGAGKYDYTLTEKGHRHLKRLEEKIRKKYLAVRQDLEELERKGQRKVAGEENS